MITIVPIYAALLGLLFLWLSMRVVKTRRLARVAVGDGGNPILTRAIAVHNNFAQYVPIALLLLTFMELRPAPAWLIHLLCLTLLLARTLHAYGVSQTRENFRFRAIGITTTFFVIAAAATYLLASTAYRIM